MNKELHKIQVSQDGVFKQLSKIGVKEDPKKNFTYYLKKPIIVMSNMSLLAWIVVGVMAAMMMLVN